MTRPEGITYPPIDDLLEKTDSKYSLVIYAAKRARQINSYFTPTEGMLQYVGPLVDAYPQEKSLSIALREIDEGKVRSLSAEEARAQAEAEAAATDQISEFDQFDLAGEDGGLSLENDDF